MAILSRRLIRLDCMGGIISPLMVVLMEASWIYPWLVWTREMSSFHCYRTPLNFASLVFLIGMPYIITRFIPARRRVMWWVKIGMVLLTIPVVINIEYGAGLAPLSGQWFVNIGRLIQDSFTVFHPIIPALIASAYLCWRGIRLGNTPFFLNDVYRSFLFGLFAIILLIIVWTTSIGVGSLESLTSSVGLQIAGFFFFGLTALAMGNFLNIRQRLLREEATPLSNRRWFIILFAVIGGIVLIGMGIASIFSPGFISTFVSTITRFFGNLFHSLNHLLEYIFIPLGYIFKVISYIMNFIINLIRSKTTIADFEFPGFDIEGLPEATVPEPVSFDIIMVLKWVFFAIVVIGVIFLIIKASSRLRSQLAEADVEEFSESLWSWLGFRADLRLFFSRLFGQWFRKRTVRLKGVLPPASYSDDTSPDGMDIREIYSHLLWETSSSGLRHRSYETPYEYAGRLETTMPGIDEQMNGITDLYVNARYGESELKNWETEHANVLWRLLRKLLRKPGKDTNQ